MDDPHWKVLLVDLAQHRALIGKLLPEGHEVETTEIFAEAYLHIATNDYHIIIVEADDDPAGTEGLVPVDCRKALGGKGDPVDTLA